MSRSTGITGKSGAETEATEDGEADVLISVPRYPTSKAHQIRVLIRRQGMDSLKDPHKFFRMLGVKTAVRFSCSFFGGWIWIWIWI